MVFIVNVTGSSFFKAYGYISIDILQKFKKCSKQLADDSHSISIRLTNKC